MGSMVVDEHIRTGKNVRQTRGKVLELLLSHPVFVKRRLSEPRSQLTSGLGLAFQIGGIELRV